MMDRRTFISARRKLLCFVAGALIAASIGTRAQPPRKIPVVGFLGYGNAEASNLFRTTMRELGYIEGASIIVEPRFAKGDPALFPLLALELVRLNVDVLYATGPAAARAAKDATSAIPIVVLDLETDPVRSGMVRSLAQPGGNITGSFLDQPAIAGKWLQLLSEAAPGRRRVGLLWDATTGTDQLVAAKAAAQSLGTELRILEIRRSDDLDRVLLDAPNAGATAVAMLASPIISGNSKRIAEIMTRIRLPAISPFRAFADNGGLMSYGPHLLEFRRFAATYVDRILKGAKPAELPIQQSTKFQFVVNVKAAKALGLTIPQTLLLRADEVIQ